MTPPPPPAELARLAQLLGAERLLLLVEQRGGERVYVPHRPRGALVRLLGHAAAANLCAEFGGSTITVPLSRAWLVRSYAAAGLNQRAIARRLRITESAVWRLLRDARGARQPDLFA